MEGRYAQEIESGFVYNYGYQCVLSEDSVVMVSTELDAWG